MSELFGNADVAEKQSIKWVLIDQFQNKYFIQNAQEKKFDFIATVMMRSSPKVKELKSKHQHHRHQ